MSRVKDINDINNGGDHIDHLQTLAEKCRTLGRKDSNWEEIVNISNEALTYINHGMGKDHDKNKNHHPDNDNEEFRTTMEATISGYKGFSLMKLNKIDEAFIALSRSYELRRQNNVALIQDEKRAAVVNCERVRHNASNSNTSAITNSTSSKREKRESIQVEKVLIQCCQMKGIDAPLPPLTKFSRTRHLFNTGGTAVSNDDLVMTKDDYHIYNQMIKDGQDSTNTTRATTSLYIEEKVDGANFGLSLSSGKIIAQNRSHYISSGDHAQFSPLASWVEEHRTSLTNILSHGVQSNNKAASQGLVLYGEWVVARHSLPYQRLPAHFIAFDIYDRKLERFWSRSRLHSIMKGSGIPVVPLIKHGKLDTFDAVSSSSQSFRNFLLTLLETKSKFRNDGGYVEGIILRIDDNNESDNNKSMWLKSRMKIVRPDFVAGCSDGHWSRRDIEKQTIDYEFAKSYLEECYYCAED